MAFLRTVSSIGASCLLVLGPLACASDSADGGSGSSGLTSAGEDGESESDGTESSGEGSGTSASGTSDADGGDGEDTGATAGEEDTTGSDEGTTEDSTDSGGDESDATTGDTSDTDTGEEEETDTTGEEETDTTGGMECNDVDPVVLYLSPDDSNSMSAGALVRDRILGGSTYLSNVPVERPWEFMNYYHFAYPAADPGTVALSASMVEEAEEGRYRMQLAVTSETVTQAARAPINLSLVLDTSGSMTGEPMDNLKHACRAIAASLKAGDTVSMVEWDTSNEVTLAGFEVSGPNDPTLLEKIDELTSGGGTDLNGGLTSGFELSQQVWDPDRINRLVLISDGGANAGVTEADLIAENAAFAGADGIYLVGIGVGDSTYNDGLMDTVTDAGKGAAVFINDEAEAWKMLNQNFVNTMAVAARDVQIELEMPPGFEIVKFSGEEFSGDPTEIEPQHLAPNDSMVFHQVVETCAPELVDAATTEITVTVTYRDPLTFESFETAQTFTFQELLAADEALLRKGHAIFAYSEALQGYEATNSSVAKQAALSAGLDVVEAGLDANPGDPDLIEVQTVLQTLVE